MVSNNVIKQVMCNKRQVHLRQDLGFTSILHFCGGTILDKFTILTAAHCYNEKDLDSDDFFITAGIVNVEL